MDKSDSNEGATERSAASLRDALEEAKYLLIDAMVQLVDGKIKTRRNRARLIRDFLENEAATCPPCNHNCNQGRDCPARKHG